MERENLYSEKSDYSIRVERLKQYNLMREPSYLNRATGITYETSQRKEPINFQTGESIRI